MSDELADRDMDLARLRAGLRREASAEPARVGDVALSMREIAVKSLVAQHGITRAEALGVLAAAERERQASASDPVETARREAAERAEREASRLVRLVGEIGVPVRPEVLERLVRGDGNDTGPMRDVAQWLGSPRRVLVAIGDMGTGKTVAACAAIVAALKARQTAAYVRETDLVKWSRSSALASEDKLDRLRNVGMLVVDELEQTMAQDAEAAGIAVAQIVDARVRAGRTVLVGNMNSQGFVHRYGRRCMDRIREVGTVCEYKLANGERSLRAAR